MRSSCAIAICLSLFAFTASPEVYAHDPFDTLHVAFVGDSLSVDFHVDRSYFGIASMIRARSNGGQANLVEDEDPSPDSPFSFIERLREIRPAGVINYAKVSASAVRTELSANERLMGTRHLGQQLADVLESQTLPRLTILWIGHNEMDWATDIMNPKELKEYSGGQPLTAELLERREAIFLNHSRKFGEAIHDQLQDFLIGVVPRLHELDGRPMAVVVNGLIHFESFFEGRDECHAKQVEFFREPRNRGRTSEVPYPSHDFAQNMVFQSMKPQFRDGVVRLAQLTNEQFRESVRLLNASVAQRGLSSKVKFFLCRYSLAYEN